MIDLSDGLSTDLMHLCEESEVAALIDAELLPIHPRARIRRAGLALALDGGEDYELLFTAPASAHVPSRIGTVSVARIGEIVRRTRDKPESELLLYGEKLPLISRGWEHFKTKR